MCFNLPVAQEVLGVLGYLVYLGCHLVPKNVRQFTFRYLDTLYNKLSDEIITVEFQGHNIYIT